MNNSQNTKNSQPEQEKERCVGCEACIDTACGRDECPKGWPKAAQPEQEPESNAYDDQRNSMEQAFRKPEQEPVAMKFKIYKPTVPDPTRQGINNALLPWVYDQDRSSGFDASMWVTPVATLPPQRKPLTDEQLTKIITEMCNTDDGTCDTRSMCRAIEAAHGIGEQK